MESIQSNFLTNKQLMTIIPNKETRHVIKNLSIIKKDLIIIILVSSLFIIITMSILLQTL